MEADTMADTEVALEGITVQGLITVPITAGDTVLTDIVLFGFPVIGHRFVIPWVADRSGYPVFTDS